MTESILGTACFKTLTHYFSLENPANHWDLNQYGADLPAYLAKPPNQFAAFQDIPYLSDLAQLEWGLHQAYYAADRKAFPATRFNTLTATDQTKARLIRAADIQLLKTPWPLYECWQHWQQTGTLPDTLAGNEVPQLLNIHRPDLQPTISRLEPEAYQLLTEIPNKNLAELANDPNLAPTMHLITEFIQQGWITDFDISPTHP